MKELSIIFGRSSIGRLKLVMHNAILINDSVVSLRDLKLLDQVGFLDTANLKIRKKCFPMLSDFQ